MSSRAGAASGKNVGAGAAPLTDGSEILLVKHSPLDKMFPVEVFTKILFNFLHLKVGRIFQGQATV